ncbi:hypothetical protein BON30_27405 [Cystobacter ferrugineus]|uniref:Uncharacterized protein n=1 Tax=Cystobacter ferrugineus TaxID=83449 RepID=A0A1L9B6L4_9BACT|nr:hypothetical protein BON30_27405 [Cystobacter ferrugineus]
MEQEDGAGPDGGHDAGGEQRHVLGLVIPGDHVEEDVLAVVAGEQPRQDEQLLAVGSPEEDVALDAHRAQQGVRLVDLRADVGRRFEDEPVVRVRVVAQLVSLGEGSGRELRVALEVLPHHEEGCLHSVPLEDVEDGIRLTGLWPIIEGECHDTFRGVHAGMEFAEHLECPGA